MLNERIACVCQCVVFSLDFFNVINRTYTNCGEQAPACHNAKEGNTETYAKSNTKR